MTRFALYLPNPSFESDYLASDEALELVSGLAEDGVPIAKALAPKRDGFIEDGIEAEAGFVDGVATGRINSKDFKSHWHENGTKRHGPTPFLRPAAEQVTGSPVTD
jgi:hypothetical protein